MGDAERRVESGGDAPAAARAQGCAWHESDAALRGAVAYCSWERDEVIDIGVDVDTHREELMTETWRVATENGLSKFTRGDDGSSSPSERRGPNRPKGDSRLPAHIMAAVRDTVRAAAATCVDPSRLEASGPYEWLAIVESEDAQLSGLLRGYIESCRYLDELEHHGVDVGHTRRADAVRDATFARDSMKRSLDAAIRQKQRAD
jgi:hypothetical protein